MPRLSAARILLDLGRRISEIRNLRHLTQESLAERARFSVRELQRIEAGRIDVGIGRLVVLANALGATMADLFQAPSDRGRRRPGRPPANR